MTRVGIPLFESHHCAATIGRGPKSQRDGPFVGGELNIYEPPRSWRRSCAATPTLNSESLSPFARHAAAGGRHARNPFSSILSARWKSSTPSMKRCASSVTSSDPPGPASTFPPGRERHGISEAPRGRLYHRYDIGADGLVRAATIVSPTAQNQAAIEHEMAELVAGNLMSADEVPPSLCEIAIRTHDPRISCSAHFLTLTADRR